MSAPVLTFDHLVIAAKTLDAGMAWVRDRLDVQVPRGGAHALMATHNCIARIGERTYVEIIAVNPDDVPERARWFSLDDPTVQTRLRTRGPYLHHWVASTPDLDASLAAARHDAGVAIEMARERPEGALRWRIAVADDGLLARGGLLPTLIEWPEGVHPAPGMTDIGWRLDSLLIETPEAEAVTTELAAVGGSGLARVEAGDAPRLVAHMRRGDDTAILSD
ncbi:MAG: VOC family protein [Pseudomonadota bacterium]